MKTIYPKAISVIVYCFSLIGFTTMQIAPAKAQTFPGLPQGRQAGIFSVLANPANLADSGKKWDVNLFAIHASAMNNNASFSISDFGKTFNSDDLLDQVTGNNTKPTSALVSADILGPSFMVRLNPKSAVAIHSRVRALVSVKNADGALLNEIADEEENYPLSINTAGSQLAGVHGWTEIGASYSRNVLLNSQYKVDAGLTLKLIGGAATGYASANNINGTLDNDLQSNDGSYLQNTTGNIHFGFAGVSFDDFDNEDLVSFGNIGFGADLGASFTWYGNNATNKPYVFRAGLSLMDIGSIKYDADANKNGSYNININGNERFYLDAFDDVALDEINNVFTNRPEYFTPSGTNADSHIKVSLPTRLLLDADYAVSHHFFVGFQGQFSLLKQDAAKPYNTAYYGGFALTPRFVTGAIGAALPISYNTLSKLNVGAALQLGPVVVGSGSILSALLGNSKQADAYFGIRFGRRIRNKVVKDNI